MCPGDSFSWWPDASSSSAAPRAPPPGLGREGCDHRRELFPIPPLPAFLESRGSHGGGSRTAVRNRHLRLAARAEASEAIDALNALYGCDEVAPSGVPPTPAQANVHHRLLSRARAFRQDFEQRSPHEAARELLGSRMDYSGAGCAVEPYAPEKVSLPRLAGAPVRLEDVLDPHAREALVDFRDHILTDDHTYRQRLKDSPVRPYQDVRIREDRGVYLGFLRSLFERGLLGSSGSRRGRVTPFFVSKKGGSQRLVFDCRRTNQMFCHAPFTEIGCSEAFSSIEVPSGQCLYSASADVVSCFYQCGIPVDLSEYFCLDAISGAEALLIGFTHNLDGTPILGSEAELFPALLVLPMGWGWAFWFVQRAHFEILRRANVPMGRIALGGWPIPRVSEGPIEIPYCDNVTVVGLDAGSVVELRDVVLDAFRLAGFDMHEITAVSSSAVVLGGDLGGAVATSQRTLPKAWTLRRALQWLARGPRVTGQQVEVLVGHYVSACNWCRDGMSVMRSLYTFIQDCYYVPTKLWASARYEAWIMACLVPLLFSDLTREWSSCVTVGDASLSGLGVCERTLDVDTVREIGSWRERWRFKRLDPLEWAPRKRALGELDVVTDPQTVVVDQVPRDRQWAHLEGFPEVPAWVTDPDHWNTIYAGRFKFKEHIGILEGRTYIWSLRRAARNPANHDT